MINLVDIICVDTKDWKTITKGVVYHGVISLDGQIIIFENDYGVDTHIFTDTLGVGRFKYLREHRKETLDKILSVYL